MVMRPVLTCFARAATVAVTDPEASQRALDDARGHWPQLTAEEQQALLGVGRLLAAAPADDAVAQALQALEAVAGDRGQAPVARRRLQDVWGQLSADARDALTALGVLVMARAAAAPADEETAAMLSAYDGYDMGEEDPYAGGIEQAPSGLDLGEAFEATPAARAVGIETDLTPEQLLDRVGLPSFRPGQRDAVQAALDGRDVLLVMPTGGGKSLAYELPSMASDALTIVVSPLIALIADQHRRFVASGVRAVMLAGTLGEDANKQALASIRSGDAQVVFCAPERFASRAFRRALADRRIGLFVVDEAHCVSEWGHDFRPDYLRLRPVIDELGRPPVMAATATATPKVADEIVTRLGLRDPLMVRRGFDRPNLSFDVITLAGDGAVARKRGALLEGLKDPANRPAVVYCGTRRDTEQVAADLAAAGLTAACYHAGIPDAARETAQRKFMSGQADVIVATNAFGMGVDKSDIRSVWHWALPTSVEAYYQEAGRAGRDGQPARAVLLAMNADLGRLVRFIKDAEMSADDVERALISLRRKAENDVAVIDPRDSNDKARVALAVAERAGAVSVAPAGAGQLAVRFESPLDRAAAQRVCREATNRRWEAYQALKRFAATDDVCRRAQLLEHFGDTEPAAPEGRCCDVCAPLDWLTVPQAGVPSSRSPKKRSSQPGAGPPVDPNELEALKAWRTEQADGKPAYTVLSNATLEDVLRARPRTKDQLAAIKGFGPAKLAKYGDSLLAVVAGI